MNFAALPLMRLLSQRLVSSECTSALQTVSWMGAIQAQDYNMCKWAVGIRTPGATENSVQKEIDKGTIIRTHVLRPTWHLVPAKDLQWMLQLTAHRIKGSMNARNRELALTPAVFRKSNKLLEDLLSGGKHATRAEIISTFKKAKIAVDENRMSHLLGWAELDGLICSGANIRGKATHALIADRIKMQKQISDEEALARLTEKYFFSHAPATASDFTWWSGLNLTLARRGIEVMGRKLISEKIEGVEYWMPPSLKNATVKKGTVHLLPAFDEFLIAYKDRSALIPAGADRKIISINGVFWPVIIVDGRVIGGWGKEVKLFVDTSKKVKSMIADEMDAYKRFLSQ